MAKLSHKAFMQNSFEMLLLTDCCLFIIPTLNITTQNLVIGVLIEDHLGSFVLNLPKLFSTDIYPYYTL